MVRKEKKKYDYISVEMTRPMEAGQPSDQPLIILE